MPRLVRALGATVVAALGCTGLRPAFAGTFTVGGYAKAFPLAYRPADGALADLNAALLGRVRLRARWRARGAVSAELAYELAPSLRPADGLALGDVAVRRQSLPYRAYDLRVALHPADELTASAVLAQNLDRAVVTARTRHADVSAGRQAVAFGSGRAVNPTDVIAPFAYQTLDKEERLGVDALRVRVPLGALSELDGGVVLGRAFAVSRSAAFLRCRTTVYETDVSAVAMRFRQHVLAGLDVARAIGGAGWWLEGAYVTLNRSRGPGARGSFAQVVSGVDYHFGGAYAMVEYHLNGAGAVRPPSYTSLAERPAYQDANVYLLGRHYLSPALVFTATPLLTVSVHALVNVSDGSALPSLRMEYGLAEDVSLEAGAFVGLGRTPDAHGGTVRFRSEFGAYPDVLFGAARLYF
jgi:hypothetical protein